MYTRLWVGRANPQPSIEKSSLSSQMLKYRVLLHSYKAIYANNCFSNPLNLNPQIQPQSNKFRISKQVYH